MDLNLMNLNFKKLREKNKDEERVGDDWEMLNGYQSEKK